VTIRGGSPSRRALILDEMGIGPVWHARRLGEPAESAGEDDEPAATDAQVPQSASALEPSGESPIEGVSAPAISSSTPSDLLVRSSPVTNEEIGQMDWGQLQAAVATCTRCALCASRNKTVFGVGDATANWLFIGEGPGYNEDRQGEPFVGPAGKLLDNMMAAMDLRRGEKVFITNIVKCRPTDASGKDRAPTPAEAGACMPYLERQISLMQPRMLVALGKTAAVSLLRIDAATSLGSLRGRLHRHAKRPLAVTYHPAYLLRMPRDKAKSWEDLCLALEAEAQITADTDGDAAS
jgi:uracil-DNA glycosylase family 4